MQSANRCDICQKDSSIPHQNRHPLLRVIWKPYGIQTYVSYTSI